MTECNDQALHFSRLGSKAVLADFNGGRLTTDAGALLLRELGDKLGLLDALDAAIPDPRDPALIVHDQRALLAQRVVAIALGYEDLNDHQALRSDPALQLAAGRVPEPGAVLASPPTLCRLENRVDRKSLVRIANVLVDQFIASHREPPESLILAGFSGGGQALNGVVWTKGGHYHRLLTEIWCFDCMYSGEGDSWAHWARHHKSIKLRVRLSTQEGSGSPRHQCATLHSESKGLNVDIAGEVHSTHEGLPGKFISTWL